MNKDKAVVFGGSGFLGSHVADELTKKGYETIIFDSTKSKWCNENQKMIVGDILDTNHVFEVTDKAKVVYNFAAIADLNAALSRPKDTAEINILGNINILDSCVENKVSRFVYASSVYAISREGGFYKCSKNASEMYTKEYKNTFDLDYTILRYGSLYGQRTDETNGLHKIISEAITSGEIRYKGNPESLREYIYVLDASQMSVEILNEEFSNKTYVLTGQEPMKVSDVLHMIAEILGYPSSSVKFDSARYAGHYVRTPYAYDNSLSRKYIPPVHIDLGQGIIDLIDFLKKSKD